MGWNKYGTKYKNIWMSIVIQLLIVMGMLATPVKGQYSQSNNGEKISWVSTFADMKVNEDIAILNKIISIKVKKVGLMEALNEIARQTNLKIAYNEPVMEHLNKKVTLDLNQVTVHDALWKILEDTGLRYAVSSSRNLVLIKRQEETPSLSPSLYQETITGQVTDANTGENLPAVNIAVKGTTTGTSTDADGNYELSVPSLRDTLLFSFIGYRTREVPINGRTQLNIALQPQAVAGEELVVVGYGVQRKSDITGSVGMVSKEDIEQPTFNALQSLRGKVAGVNIFTNSGSPTGSNRVIIRGVGSINTSGDPLYVVDGLAMDNIEMMNPNDIQSIEVLKDASATAIYGARGANGVILITTERGSIEEGIIVGYEGNFSVGNMRGRMDVMNAEEFMEVQRIGVENAPIFNDYEPGNEPTLDLSDERLFDSEGNPLYDTDWQEETTRTAISHDQQLSIQSGGENSSVGVFLNYTNKEGIYLNSYMKRGSIKLVYDVNREWFSFGTNLTMSRIWENDVPGEYSGTSRNMIESIPIFPVKWPDGTWSNGTQAKGFSFEANYHNAVHNLVVEDRLRDRTHLFGNTFLTLHITDNLEFRTQFGLNNRQHESRFYSPSDLIGGGSPDGVASISNNEMFYWQNENFLTYAEEIGAHRINSVLGASWQQNLERGNSLSARGFGKDFFKYNNIGTATEPNAPNSYANDWTLNSYFTRVSYTYSDAYMITLTGRVDGSSRFGENSKYGFFPSVGVAWLISDEDFMSDLNFIDHLRFRSSYGVTGNTEIGLYNSLATIGSGTTLIGGERQASSYVQRMPNPELEWEKTQQFNVGAELTLFNRLISLEADYYYRYTHDLLLNRPIASTSGFTSIMDNIGSVSNRGVDFMITTRNIRSDDFSWSTTLNFNYNKNRVESLGANDEDIFPGPFWVSGSQTILRVGEPIGNFYGFERLGTWNTDEAEEAAEVGRIPGEAKRSEDRKIIGNGLPDLSGSFINKLSFRNFDFTADIQFVYGSEIMQEFLHTAEDRQAMVNGLRTQLYNAWTEDNQNTMYQRIRHQPLSGQNTQADSHWIVDGSYIRGNLFSLGYSFDSNILTSLGLQHLRINASVTNAFVIHHPDFKGHDPEASSWEGNPNAQNIFFYQYPKARTFTFGINTRF